MSKPIWENVSSEMLEVVFLDIAKALSLKGEREVPAWMGLPGANWPMYLAILQLAKKDSSFRWADIINLMSKLPSSNPEIHWNSFEKFISGKNRSQICFHESKFRNGRLLGPTTFQVRALYQEVGLKVDGAELADHVSVELEFMSYLCQQINLNDPETETWKKARDLFYSKHLEDWMPHLGQNLKKSDDTAWIIIGNILFELFSQKEIYRSDGIKGQGYPSISIKEKCSLCGFCAQVCPSSALQINEDDENTALCLNNNLCFHCNKCVLICPEKTLALTEQSQIKDILFLLKSPRALCTSCQEPTVSQAELDFTSEKLGHPGWLSLCLDCRSINMEKII